MSMYDLAALQKNAEVEIEEAEKKKQDREGLPLVYPVENGTFRIKLLFNPKANTVQRKITRHAVGKSKVPCMSMYGEECSVCKAIASAEEESEGCGARSKYGYKTRGICIAVLVDYDKGMFNDKNSPKKGDLILLMYPPTLYNAINEIIVKSGSNIESLVAANEGKTIEITRKQKNGGFPEYAVNVYAYGDDKIKETDEEFEQMMENLPNLNEQMCPSNPTDAVYDSERAACETIQAEFKSGAVINPNNPEDFNKPKDEPVSEASEIIGDNKPSENGEHPDCYGKHSDSQKCLVCPIECDCIMNTN